MTDFRKKIHDEIINDLKTLTHHSSSNLLFADVKKIFVDYPNQTPVCEVTPSTTEIFKIDTNQDARVYIFDLIVYDLLAEQAGETELNKRIDRLQKIEDRLLDYIEKLPNDLEGAITGIKIYTVEPSNNQYLYEQSEQGIKLYLTMQIKVYVLTSVR